MFSRRLATFLLGIWIGGSILIDMLALQGQRVVNRILDNPNADVQAQLSKGGGDAAQILMRHVASEQTRANLNYWESAQLVLALAMGVALVFTDQRKPLAIGLCGVMALLVVIQHYAITPDLSALGRQADFLPEASAFSVRTQIWTRTQTYGVLEALKLVFGGGLASYFFAMESTVRRARGRARRNEESSLTAS